MFELLSHVSISARMAPHANPRLRTPKSGLQVFAYVQVGSLPVIQIHDMRGRPLSTK